MENDPFRKIYDLVEDHEIINGIKKIIINLIIIIKRFLVLVKVMVVVAYLNFAHNKVIIIIVENHNNYEVDIDVDIDIKDEKEVMVVKGIMAFEVDNFVIPYQILNLTVI